LSGFQVALPKSIYDYRVIKAIDEIICGFLVLSDPEFGVYILLKIILIPVEMVWCDIQQYGDVSLKIEHAIKLKAADFQDEELMIPCRHLHCKTLAYIPCKPCIKPRSIKNMVRKGCSSGFSIASCNAYKPGVSKPGSKFDLRNDRDPFASDLADERNIIRYPRTLYHFICL